MKADLAIFFAFLYVKAESNIKKIPRIKNPKIDKIMKTTCGTKLLSVTLETFILWLSFGLTTNIIMMMAGTNNPKIE